MGRMKCRCGCHTFFKKVSLCVGDEVPGQSGWNIIFSRGRTMISQLKLSKTRHLGDAYSDFQSTIQTQRQ
jgi:hypothetical protein